MPDLFMFVLSNVDLPPSVDWRPQVNDWKPLLPLTFIRIESGPEGRCAARVGDRAIRFTCTATSVASLVRERHPELERCWRYAYGFRGIGGEDGWISGTTAAIARATYASLTHGALYHENTGAYPRFTSGWDRIDAVFAQEFDAWDLYRARYPDQFESKPSGPMTMEVRLVGRPDSAN